MQCLSIGLCCIIHKRSIPFSPFCLLKHMTANFQGVFAFNPLGSVLTNQCANDSQTGAQKQAMCWPSLLYFTVFCTWHSNAQQIFTTLHFHFKLKKRIANKQISALLHSAAWNCVQKWMYLQQAVDALNTQAFAAKPDWVSISFTHLILEWLGIFIAFCVPYYIPGIRI